MSASISNEQTVELHKDWLEKAKIDYFQPFLMLWMHFNFWMQTNYKNEVAQSKSDRPLINKIKSDTTNNAIYNRFKVLFSDRNNNKDALQFRSDLETLHYALENVQMRYPTQVGKKPYYPSISFNSLLIDYEKRKYESAYEKMLICLASEAYIKETPPEGGNLLGVWYVKDEPERFFAGLIEAIYQIRCELVHGSLRTSSEVHEVIKYCYFVLFNLMDQ